MNYEFYVYETRINKAVVTVSANSYEEALDWATVGDWDSEIDHGYETTHREVYPVEESDLKGTN